MVDAVDAALKATGGNLELAKPSIKQLLFDLFDAVWDLPGSTLQFLVFRDAADRIQEEVLSRIWTYLSANGGDRQALDLMLWATQAFFEWEGRIPGQARYIHKGNPYFLGAISSFRLGNLDLGFLLLEAAEEGDLETYKRAGNLPGGNERPGTFFLSLDPNINNALHMEVVRLRGRVQAYLRAFNSTSGVPNAKALIISDFDQLFLRDPSWRPAVKQWVHYLLWTDFMVEDPRLQKIPRGGEFSGRRHAEILLALLTGVEEIVRYVDGGKSTDRGYISVLSSVIANEPGCGLPPDRVRKILGDLEHLQNQDPDISIKYWASNRTGPGGTPLPWYVQWLEPARLLRNKIAHFLETPTPIRSSWPDADKVARFAVFCSIWLLRERGAPPTLLYPTALSSIVGNPRTQLQPGAIAPSGVATSMTITGDLSAWPPIGTLIARLNLP